MLGRLAALVVRGYQLSLSKYLPSRCRFEPSCSHYAIEALRENGLIVGAAQTIWRLLRCAPWGKPGYDPVPTRSNREASAHG